MKSLVIALLILTLAVVSCQEPEKKQSTAQTESATAYLPVSDLIRTEIMLVDSTPTGILRRITYKGKTDSAFIKPAEFDELAQAFLPQELEYERFQKSFKESSFMDQTTESIAFNYESIDSTSTVSRVDVLAAPSLELDKIKNVYIEKTYMSGDTTVQQKMTWKPKKSFQVITIKSLGSGAPDVHQLKVIWDPFSYQD